MKYLPLLLVLVVLVPAVFLGRMALTTSQKQQAVLERRTSDLYSKTTDQLAARARDAVLELEDVFVDEVDRLLATRDATELGRTFDQVLRSAWPVAGIGFAVASDGRILSPRPEDSPEARRFLGASADFLANRATETFFLHAPLLQAQLPPGAREGRQNTFFRSATVGAASGILSRIVGGHLEILVWRRPAQRPDLIFGAMVVPGSIGELDEVLSQVKIPDPASMCLALLDERGRPLWQSRPGFRVAGRAPFVTSAVGEVLPFHQAALYLDDPGQFLREARSFERTVRLLVVLALTVLAGGALLIALEVRRRSEEARRRADFVSSVSHELKSPLTSIRMFAELLERGDGSEPARRKRYLEIIGTEARRLGTLLDDILDLARSERKTPLVEPRPLDAAPVVREVWERAQPRLQTMGLRPKLETDPPPWPVLGDAGAIARVLDSLLDNAAKHAVQNTPQHPVGHDEEVVLRARLGRAALTLEVLDRGPGVATEQRERIFEPFVRADDTLSSGSRGAGLGLALARRLARGMGGDLVYEDRSGGGACFRLTLPVAGGAS